jgi:hypothetical protein
VVLIITCSLHSTAIDDKDLLVLLVEDITYQDDQGNQRVDMPVIVFTCKSMLQVLKKHKDEKKCGMADTTFKLMQEGWVLCCIGNTLYS